MEPATPATSQGSPSRAATEDLKPSGDTTPDAPASETLPTHVRSLALNAKPQDDLRATLERERQHLQQLFDTANAALVAREAEIESRTAHLDERERQLVQALQDLRDRELQMETDARERAAATEADARARAEELERVILDAEQELLQTQQSTDEHIQTLLAEAETQAEQIVSRARQDAELTGERTVELLRLREGLIASVRETISRFDETLTRAEQDEPHLPDGVDEDRAAAHAPRQSGDEDDRALLEQSASGSQPEEPAAEDGSTDPDLVEESPAGDESDASRC